LALRDLLRKLGLASGDDVRETGVRRARLPQRAADAPTIRVPLNPGGLESSAPAPPPAMSAASLVRPTAAPVAVPAAAPLASPPRPHAARSAAPGADLGGATQYFQMPAAAGDLVGVLAAIAGPLKGQVFTVSDGETRLGREGCEVTLRSQRISRYHAKIVHVDGAFVIEANPEVAARNPTVVNEQTVDAEALCDGDVIQLGDCTFKFRTI
jgi:predicted component of type VI protein secretion system